MKRGELERILRSNGCYPLKSGKRHDRWYSPKTGLVIIIPRHEAKEIPVGTLRVIVKQAGI
ncbi:MAG: type II toxin-antitoxin system HicA family toxin [Bacteroidales bacterium]|nr:type II toxin-antitoxin system HicA family toxin [Bacteroidales bacterium]